MRVSRPQLLKVPSLESISRDYFLWRKSRFLVSWERVGMSRVGGSLILDIGAGQGASSAVLAEQGARVIAGDLCADLLIRAQEFCRGAAVELVQLAAEALPFPSNMFDGVVLFDVLEHVAAPDQAVAELARVIRPGGWIFIEFTPYHSLAGHHLYDYTFLPVQFLPHRWVHRYVRWTAARRSADPTEWLRVFDGLNGLSIGDFHRMRKRLGLALLRESYFLRPPRFEISVGFLRFIPPLRELLTTSYSCLLRYGDTPRAGGGPTYSPRQSRRSTPD